MERQRSSKPVISSPANDATAQAGGPSRRQVLRGAGAGPGRGRPGPGLRDGRRHQSGPGPDDRAGVRHRVTSISARTGSSSSSTRTASPIPTGAYANAQAPGSTTLAGGRSTCRTTGASSSPPFRPRAPAAPPGSCQGGLAWYRKHFTLPSSLAGQRISIEFDGVYRNSNVYLNGKLLGNHPYAYTGLQLRHHRPGAHGRRHSPT